MAKPKTFSQAYPITCTRTELFVRQALPTLPGSVAEAVRRWAEDHGLDIMLLPVGRPILRDPRAGTVTYWRRAKGKEPVQVVDQAPPGTAKGTWPGAVPARAPGAAGPVGVPHLRPRFEEAHPHRGDPMSTETSAETVAGLPSEVAQLLHHAFHEAWPDPAVPLDLYALSAIWEHQAAALAPWVAQQREEVLRDLLTEIEDDPIRSQHGGGANTGALVVTNIVKRRLTDGPRKHAVTRKSDDGSFWQCVCSPRKWRSNDYDPTHRARADRTVPTAEETA